MTFIQFQTRVLNIFQSLPSPISPVKRSYEVKMLTIILHFTIQKKGARKKDSEYTFKTTFSVHKFQKCCFGEPTLAPKIL